MKNLLCPRYAIIGKKKRVMHKTDIDSILSELMFKKRNIKDP